MEFSNSTSEIFTAMSQAINNITDPHRDTKAHNYKYAQIDSYLKIARPVLRDQGLSLIQSVDADGKTLTISTCLAHKSGEWVKSSFATSIEIEQNRNFAQEIGKVITYYRRYCLSAMLSMSQDDDDAASTGNTYNNSYSAPRNKPLISSPPQMQSSGPTEPQIKRLHAIKNGKGHSDTDVKNYMKDNFLKESTKTLTKLEYDQVCNWMQKDA